MATDGVTSPTSAEHIRDNVTRRFTAGAFYTSVGKDILVSVNPLKPVTIYGDAVRSVFSSKPVSELPPHVFGIAQMALDSLRVDRENQCIVMGGESGSGKTEAAKLIGSYILETSVTKATPANADHAKRTKAAMSESVVLLEAFGNAKTRHNDNSSRFARLSEFVFAPESDSPLPQLVGGRVHHFLLEKGRVSNRMKNERSFHVFYQLCRGAPEEWRKEFEISKPESFACLASSGCFEASHDDVAGFEATLRAMKAVGITDQEQRDVARLLSAVLWLGNVSFAADQAGHVSATDRKPLETAARLLGIETDILQKILTVRMMEMSHGAPQPQQAQQVRGTTYLIPLNVSQACAARDSFAKVTYGALFDWIARKVNAAMPQPPQPAATNRTIGVLDFSGFEAFEENGLEQLMINFLNEKMQQMFVEAVLRRPQAEYAEEGLQWTAVPFADNKPVIELIEGKKPTPGIISMLDDVCRTVHALKMEDADHAFYQSLHSNKAVLLRERAGAFIVQHFAGAVTYQYRGMPTRNVEPVVAEHADLLCSSSVAVAQQLLPRDGEGRSASALGTTTGSHCRAAVQQIVHALSLCGTPRFVRCVKPNRAKKPGTCEPDLVREQVLYLGIVDAVKVRNASCPWVGTFENFVDRHVRASAADAPSPIKFRSTSSSSTSLKGANPKEAAVAILKRCGLAEGKQYELGKTKVFVKTREAVAAIEQAGSKYGQTMAERIVQACREYRERREKALVVIQRAYRSWRGTAPFMKLRADSEAMFVNKRERKRFSMTSLRQYVGDYLCAEAPGPLHSALEPLMTPQEIISFSYRANLIVAEGIMNNLTPVPRYLVLTNRALLVLTKTVVLPPKKERDKPPVDVYKVETRLHLPEVSWLSMSPFADGFVVITVGTAGDEYGIVLQCDLNTELVARIRSVCPALPLGYSEKLEFRRKKGASPQHLQFIRSDTSDLSSLHKGVVAVAAELPPSSVPSMLRPKLSASGRSCTRKKTSDDGASSAQASEAGESKSAVELPLKRSVDVGASDKPGAVASPGGHAPTKSGIPWQGSSKHAPPSTSPGMAAMGESRKVAKGSQKPASTKGEVVVGHQAASRDEASVGKGEEVLVYDVSSSAKGWTLILVSRTGQLGFVPTECVQPITPRK